MFEELWVILLIPVLVCSIHSAVSDLSKTQISAVFLSLNKWSTTMLSGTGLQPWKRQTVPSSWNLYWEGFLNNDTNLTLFKILQCLPIAGLKSSTIETHHLSSFISQNFLWSSHTSSFPWVPESPLMKSPLCHHSTLHRPVLKHWLHHTAITLYTTRLNFWGSEESSYKVVVQNSE